MGLLLHSVPEPVEGTFSLLISVPEPVEGTFSLLISVPERSRRHIISIALKSVCFLEHLWCSFENSKTASFQQISVNFVILKQIQKIYTQWLRELRSQTFSLCSTTNSSITRCLSVVEGTFSLLIPLPEPVEGRARKNWLFLFVLMLQFLFYSPPNFVQKSTNLFIHNSFKEM